jgi:hypothetical protein
VSIGCVTGHLGKKASDATSLLKGVVFYISAVAEEGPQIAHIEAFGKQLHGSSER